MAEERKKKYSSLSFVHDLPYRFLVVNLFYSGSLASTTAGSAAVLLPSTSPLLDVNSLSNLQAKTLQTLYYEQVWDRSAPVNSYRAIIDYEFQVPSVVFDHSSLIYVVNQTDQTIVFGFGNADAFAQTLGWPQAGIAMLFKGECLSSNANDVFMLNGFIYDPSRLTVAANFTPSEIANITGNTNVTVGRNDTSTTNTTGVGDPQPYLPNVRYLGISFFNSASVNLNNAYYANLNASADSQIDNAAGCYFNSLSQALIYDIVDPRNYNDPQAYQKLVQIASSAQVSASARSIDDLAARNGRESRQVSAIDLETANNRQESSLSNIFPLTNSLFSERNSGMNSLSRRRRRRRHLRRAIKPTNVRKILIRPKRFFGSVSDIFEEAVDNAVDAAEGAIDAVADVTKTAVDTVSEVGDIVKTAIVGGDYEKSGSFPIDIGYGEPKEIYSGNGIYVNCQECKVDGTIELYGKFSYGKDGLATVLNSGFVEAKGKLNGKAVARIGVNIQVEKILNVATIPLTPISVPGIFTLGPQVVLDVGFNLEVGGDLQVTFGAYMNWDDVYTKIDFKNPANSQFSGWAPSNIEPQLSYETKLTADLGIFVQPKIEVVLSILNGVIQFGAGLVARCTAGVTASYNEDSAKCVGGIELGPYVKVALSVYAEANLASNSLASTDHTLYSNKFPITSDKCIGGTDTSTPDLA